ncbi:MAG TPA: alpha/beta hydrolase [Parafilimonas sp.]|nr:alpha/beta hydrolase [Parafilimonas sp.]
MPYLNRKSANENIRIFYEDLGENNPVVFVHGWPLTHAMWEYQITPMREAGFRCIAYDRRGFGQSEQSLKNYSYDFLADDLKCLLDELNLQDVTLVGFSMGGGEVVRYCSKYNCERVTKIILVSSVVPYMLKTEDNPDGVALEQIQEFDNSIRQDRVAFLQEFGKHFYGANFINRPVSQAILDWTFSLAATASQKATLACMQSFSQTDFKSELASIKIPALIIHGDADKTVPVKATSEKAASLISGSIYKIYEGAPHGLFITDKERLTNDIASFVTTGRVELNETYLGDVDILPSNEEALVTRD